MLTIHRAVFAVVILALTPFALGGCASPPPISANPQGDIVAALPAGPVQSTVSEGLADAVFNLDQAVSVGALDANDPAPACLHAVLGDLGVGTPPAASFTPKISDLISAGSVLYIRAQQAKRLAGGGITVQIPCKALIGQLVIDAAQAGVKLGAAALPGGALLQQLNGIGLAP